MPEMFDDVQVKIGQTLRRASHFNRYNEQYESKYAWTKEHGINGIKNDSDADEKRHGMH